MKRIPIETTVPPLVGQTEQAGSKAAAELEASILSVVDIDESGYIIYAGDGPEAQRRGSPIALLIEWFLRRRKEKPLDYAIFVDLMLEHNIVRPDETE